MFLVLITVYIKLDFTSFCFFSSDFAVDLFFSLPKINGGWPKSVTSARVDLTSVTSARLALNQPWPGLTECKYVLWTWIFFALLRISMPALFSRRYLDWHAAAFSKCCLEASRHVESNDTLSTRSRNTEHDRFYSTKKKKVTPLLLNNKNRWGPHMTWRYFQSWLGEKMLHHYLITLSSDRLQILPSAAVRPKHNYCF